MSEPQRHSRRTRHQSTEIIEVQHDTTNCLEKSICNSLRKHVHAIYCDFYGRKNDNFQMKNCNMVHIYALNIDRGYTLEHPQ